MNKERRGGKEKGKLGSYQHGISRVLALILDSYVKVGRTERSNVSDGLVKRWIDFLQLVVQLSMRYSLLN